MADIVLGIATSHGPMLVTPPESWGGRVSADKEITHHWRGGIYSFDELVEARKANNFPAQITLDEWQRRHGRCMDAIERLAQIYNEVKPDIAVIVGNDQMEIFSDDFVPTFSIYAGETLVNQPLSQESWDKMPPTVRNAMPGYIPEQRAVYDSVPALGEHMIREAMKENYDVNCMRRLPGDETPHAYGFIFRQIMKDQVIPTVPVMVNTFYPPNQPRAERCYEFGKCLRRAIASWDSDLKVAVFASGGLSHFVVDEDLDNTFINCMRERNLKALTDMGEIIYQDGTSEMKNWIPVAGMMADLGFDMELVDYVPCYRSEAGTGTGNTFVAWRPQA